MRIPKLLSLTFALTLTSALFGQISPEKRAAIDEMLRLTGMEGLMAQMKDQMVAAMKPQMQNVPAVFWDKFRAKLNVGEVLERIIPLYDKYYTLEDIRAVNAFYSSPAGQKVLSTLPQIMQESMQIGQEWGARSGRIAAEEAMAELQAESQKPNKAPEPTPGAVTPRATEGTSK